MNNNPGFIERSLAALLGSFGGGLIGIRCSCNQRTAAEQEAMRREIYARERYLAAFKKGLHSDE